MLKPDHLTKPTELTIDVDQWRRDVQTFAKTTQQALEAIVAELSNRCSGGLESGIRNPIGNSPIDGSMVPSSSGISRRGNANPAEKRLDGIKSQLAERLSKSNRS